MAWYYYSGRVPCSVPVKKGLSKSVHPGTKVEILEVGPEASAMIAKGMLRPTSRDRDAMPAAEIPVPTKRIEDVKEDILRGVDGAPMESLGAVVQEIGKASPPEASPVEEEPSGAPVADGDAGAVDDSGIEDTEEKVDHVGAPDENGPVKGKGKRRR